MTELKTLKDLQTKGSEEDYVDCSVVSAKSLRQEAIKWRKKSMKLSARRIDYQTWDNFFNITEEDLK